MKLKVKELIDFILSPFTEFFKERDWNEISRSYHGIRYDGDPCMGLTECFHVWKVTEKDSLSDKIRTRYEDSWDGP